MEHFVLVAWGVVACLGTPAVLIAGWVSWSRRPRERGTFAILSFIGFSLATASALLAICSIVYARAIGGFPYYDPLLLRIYRWGSALSLGGFAFGIGGIWQKSSLRWHSPILSFGMCLLWAGWAMGE